MKQASVSEQVVIDTARELGRALGASKAFRDYERALEHCRIGSFRCRLA